jgi:hypothetical protein
MSTEEATQDQGSPTRDRSGGDESNDGIEGRRGGPWRLGWCRASSTSRYKDGTEGDGVVDCFGDARDPKRDDGDNPTR